MKYVLELGEEVNVGPEQDKEWRSAGFYAGYGLGPIIVPNEEDAYKFPNREFAENVQAGDVRLKASKIVGVV